MAFLINSIFSWVLPGRNENKCPHKDSCVNVYSRFIHNSHKLERTQPQNRFFSLQYYLVLSSGVHIVVRQSYALQSASPIFLVPGTIRLLHYWLSFPCCACHPQYSFVTTYMFLSIPSAFSLGPPTTFSSDNHQSVVCTYESDKTDSKKEGTFTR